MAENKKSGFDISLLLIIVFLSFAIGVLTSDNELYAYGSIFFAGIIVGGFGMGLFLIFIKNLMKKKKKRKHGKHIR